MKTRKIRKIRNLTPHPINLITPHGEVTIQPDPELTPPRVSTTSNAATPINLDGVEIPVSIVGTGSLTGLPDECDGVAYVVSRMVAEAAPHRRDLLIPDGLVRDQQGRVIGCQGFAQVPAVPASQGDR